MLVYQHTKRNLDKSRSRVKHYGFTAWCLRSATVIASVDFWLIKTGLPDWISVRGCGDQRKAVKVFGVLVNVYCVGNSVRLALLVAVGCRTLPSGWRSKLTPGRASQRCFDEIEGSGGKFLPQKSHASIRNRW